jgi:hypothetical protein
VRISLNTIDGQILPSRESIRELSGIETIERLRLNIPKLRAARAAALDSIYGDPDLELPLSQDEIEKLIHYYSQTEDGKYQSYCQPILYILTQEKTYHRS